MLWQRKKMSKKGGQNEANLTKLGNCWVLDNEDIGIHYANLSTIVYA
jgi:hypothetical protein